MKILLLLGALALLTSTARAQTVVPGTAVPGTVPSTQTGIPTGVSNAGSPRAPGHAAKAPNMDRSDRKMLRKMGKVKSGSDGTTKTKND